MDYLLGLRRVVSVLFVLTLTACGSSSSDEDDEGSTHTGVSTNSIVFEAASFEAATPASQTVTATFGEDVVQIGVIHSGTALANVTSERTGRTAQIVLAPNAPSSVGPGIFTAAVAITGYFCADTACTSLAAGNTQTIDVSYQVSPGIQTVAPYVALAGTSESVVIRGFGFGRFAITGVRFGDVPATEFVVGLDTEIRATHPALPAGSYPVQLDIPTHQGTVPSTATLVVIDPVAYPAQVLAYPAAAPSVRRLIYDAERSALLVATNLDGGTILRYPYAGGAWGAPQSVAVSNLQDMALTTTGEQALAISTTSLIPIDPTTVALGTAIAAPSLATNSFLKNIVMTSDNRGFITTGIATSTATSVYQYRVRNGTLEQTGTALNNGTPGASSNGASVVFIQGHPSLTTPPPVLIYSASASAPETTNIALNQNEVAPVLARTATRFVLNGTNVYATDLSLDGLLPATTAALVLNPAGTRAYTYDTTAAAILTYDISADLAGAAYPTVGSPVALAGDPGTGVKMAISPDGSTLFLAGSTQVVIQPAP